MTQLKRGISIPFLWTHLGLPGEPAKSCSSRFRPDHKESFSVYYATDKGEWRFHDFAAGLDGDIVDFWALTKRINPADAIQELAG